MYGGVLCVAVVLLLNDRKNRDVLYSFNNL